VAAVLLLYCIISESYNNHGLADPIYYARHAKAPASVTTEGNKPPTRVHNKPTEHIFQHLEHGTGLWQEIIKKKYLYIMQPLPL
jgi:hypothetical protein